MFRPLLATICVLVFADVALAQEPLGCLTEETARQQFASNSLSHLPNYTEGAGARVQRQHANTHLFGQAKHVAISGGPSLGFCQYSNHVGLVVTYGFRIAGTLDPLQGCRSAECRANPWWRTEYVESDPADKKLMQVCMVERDGQAFPSLGCRFILQPQR